MKTIRECLGCVWISHEDYLANPREAFEISDHGVDVIVEDAKGPRMVISGRNKSDPYRPED